MARSAKRRRKPTVPTTKAELQKQFVRESGIALPSFISAHRKIWLTIRRLADLPIKGQALTDPFEGVTLTMQERSSGKGLDDRKALVAQHILPSAKKMADQRLQRIPKETLTEDQRKRARLIFTAQEYVGFFSRIQEYAWKKGDIEGLAQMVSLDGVREAWVRDTINTLQAVMTTGATDEKKQAVQVLRRIGEALTEIGGRQGTQTPEARQDAARVGVAVSKALPRLLNKFDERCRAIGHNAARAELLAQIEASRRLIPSRKSALRKRFLATIRRPAGHQRRPLLRQDEPDEV